MPRFVQYVFLPDGEFREEVVASEHGFSSPHLGDCFRECITLRQTTSPCGSRITYLTLLCDEDGLDKAMRGEYKPHTLRGHGPFFGPLVLCKQYDHYSDDGETSESKPLDVDDADYLDLDTLLRSKFLGMP